jgi:LPXTG-motif cell wall-anchored protein
MGTPGRDIRHVRALPVSTSRPVVVPYRAVAPRPRSVKVNRVITAHGLGALGAGAGLAPPVGAGSGAGAEIGAAQGASIGSTILPGIGTAIGAIVGAIGGAIAGALGKVDPENVNFDQAVAIYAQNPTAVYSIANPYLALAGLFDLNIQTNIPIYRKFGHMGEAAFVVWLCNTVYQAAQAGKITASDTALTVMSKVVQPAINAWGFGPMNDPHAAVINALIVAMILQYTEGAQHNWVDVGGTYPTQFNSIPPFALPSATPAAAGSTSMSSCAATAASGSYVSAANPGPMTTPQGTWAYASGAKVFTLNGNQATSPGLTLGLLYAGGQIYAYNTGGAAYLWQGQWIQQNPTQVPSPPSSFGWAAPAATNNSFISPTSPGPMSTPSGVWAYSAPSQSFTLNGNQATSPGIALGLLYAGGNVYAYDTGGLAYLWQGQWVQQNPSQVPSPPAAFGWAAPAGTTASSAAAPVAPAAPTVLESSDGSQVTAPGTALETSSGTMIYLGPQAPGDPNNAYGYPIWESGVQNGYAVGLIMGNGGKVYAVNAKGTWYQWSASNWTQLSAAPVLNGPTTTTSSGSTSPQAGVTCTPGSGFSTTGGVIGTTSSGVAVTDTDIADMVSQMASQNATAAQTYQAIMSALQSEGVASTSAVQSQVAAQVSAGTPAASSSSNTGLYIVGGGLAILGALFFMRRRKAA